LYLHAVSKGKNRYSMEEYIESIEKFLRGQMSQEEENVFKKSLITDAHMRTCALIVAYMLKRQKLW